MLFKWLGEEFELDYKDNKLMFSQNDRQIDSVCTQKQIQYCFSFALGNTMRQYIIVLTPEIQCFAISMLAKPHFEQIEIEPLLHLHKFPTMYEFWHNQTEYLLVASNKVVELYQLRNGKFEHVNVVGQIPPVQNPNVVRVPLGNHSYWRIGGVPFGFAQDGTFTSLSVEQAIERNEAFNRDYGITIPIWKNCEGEPRQVCPVCFGDEIKAWKLPLCGHAQHAICVDCCEHLSDKRRCVICRK